jgi:hypothetical protein
MSAFAYEPFDDRKSITGAVLFQRPPRSSLSVFFNHYDAGPLQSDYLGTSLSYRFSTKYAGSVTIGYDFESNDNVSISAGITRVGLDFIATLGLAFNAGRDDLGLQFEFIPRAAVRSRYQRSNVSTLPFGIEPTATVSPIAEDRLSNLSSTFSTN